MSSGDGTGDGTSTVAGAVLTDPTFEAMLAGLESAVDVLRASNTAGLTGTDHLSLLARTETAVRALTGCAHTVLNETVEQSGFDGMDGSAPLALSLLLRITVRTANERFAIAQQLGHRTLPGGTPVEPVLPHTAAGARDGALDPAHVKVIRDFVRKVPTTVDPATVSQAEEQLARLGRGLTPDALKAAADRILAHLDPDGPEPQDDPSENCFIRYEKQNADGTTTGTFRIDAEFRALLDVIVEATGKPGARKGKKAEPTDDAAADRTAENTGASHPADDLADDEASSGTEPLDFDDPFDAPVGSGDPAEPEPEPEPDPEPRATRNPGRRVHDNLKDVLRMILASNLLGTHRGVATKAIITMTLKDLEAGTGTAITATGSFLTIPAAIRMMAHAHPYLLIFGDDGQPLHLGRGRRLATEDQRLALFAAQRGCTFPACTRPATRCQVHHVHDWARSGATDVDCLALTCDQHHRLVTDTGWATTIAPANHPYPGRTLWHPPAWLDPTRTGRINHHHHPDEYLWDPQPPT